MKVLLPASMLEARGLVKLGRFYGDDLALSSCWNSLDAKLAVYGRMDLLADMATGAKRAMRPNNFGMQFLFLYCY